MAVTYTMRRFLQRLLTKPVIKWADKLSSRPDQQRVHAALSNLYQNITTNPGKKGLVVSFDTEQDKFVILSDQHKGVRNGADIFAKAEKNYLAALEYYSAEKFVYINLGDSEELWENTIGVVKKHHEATFELEKKFLDDKAFIKIFGNHDLYWDNDPLAQLNLAEIYGQPVTIYEGIILQSKGTGSNLEIYMTHGHQGDLQSDGNWFSKWFVSAVWEPFQAYLRINPNTPAYNDQLKTLHNQMMYEWSAERENVLLITGHTHQPVFRSFTQLEILYDKLQKAEIAGNEPLIKDLEPQISRRHAKGDAQPDLSKYLDSYFNSGCCCFDDGDITGIEIANGGISLIKWKYGNNNENVRVVLEECKLKDLKINPNLAIK